MSKSIYTRIVLDISTGARLECDSFSYDGPWALAKGGNSTNEMNRANTLSDQQQALMQQQLAMQRQQFDMVNPSLRAIIANGGMLPQQEAAMRSQAMQGLGQNYSQLQGQLSSALVARGVTGGGNAGGGDIARSFGSLGAMEAGQQSSLMNQIQLAKGQGLEQAMGTSLGIAGMTGSGAQGFGSQAVGALGSGVTAANNADQATTGFWGSMIGGLAGMGGSAITKYCYVAAELYGGWLSPETTLLRDWIFTTPWMKPFAKFYKAYGKRWASAIHRNTALRFATKQLFDVFLSVAHARHT